MNVKLISILSLLLSISVVLLLSFVPAYAAHLRVDFWGQYINHAKSFLQYQNLAHIGYNEYQPVAVLFFVSLSPALNINNHFQPELNYAFAVYYANIFLILLNAYLYFKITKSYYSIIIFSLIILFTGPIILHRFELLLFLFILGAINRFKNKKYLLSGLLLGIAFCTKLFPIFLIPIFASYLLVNKKYKEIVYLKVGFILSLFLIYFVYNILLQGDFIKVFSDLKIHQLKPVHVESVYASILTVIPYLNGNDFAFGKGEWGIFGIDPKYNILPLFFYNYFFIVPMSIFYIFTFFIIAKTKKFYYEFLFILMLIFLIFSKIITGQYLLWFIMFLPLFDFKKYIKNSYFIVLVFCIFLISFLTQFIYPLKYTELLSGFYMQHIFPELFWVLFIRNLLLLAVLILGLKVFLTEYKKDIQ